MEGTELKKVTQLAWRRLIISEAGIEGMLILKERAPRIYQTDAHNIIFSAGKAEGFRQALDEIYALCGADREKSSNPVENP